MSESAVLLFRWRALGGDPERYLARCAALLEHASQLNAPLIAWAADGMAFEVSDSELLRAVRWTQGVLASSTCWAAALSARPLTRYDAGGGRILTWGGGLIHSDELAKRIKSNQLLIEKAGLDHYESYFRRARTRSMIVLKNETEVWELAADTPLGGETRSPVTARQSADAWVQRPELGELGAGGERVIRVVCAPGTGGTRFFREVQGRAGAARVATLSPGVTGEPMGALRRGLPPLLADARMTNDGNWAAALEALSQREGTNSDNAAKLVEAWARTEAGPERSWLLLDDAHRFDTDSLLAIARAQQLAGFGLLYRVPEQSRKLDVLETITQSTVVVRGMTSDTIAQLTAQSAGSELDPLISQAIARCVGERVALLPAAIEAYHSVGTDRASGLDWGAGFVGARLSALDESPRNVIIALGVAGGCAELDELQSLGRAAWGQATDLKPVLELLVEQRWLDFDGRWASFRTDTERRMVALLVPPEQRSLWHLRWSRVSVGRQAPMGVPVAAFHSIGAADSERARQYARRAAESCVVAGLLQTAECFNRFLEGNGLPPLEKRGLTVEPELLPAQADTTRSNNRANPGVVTRSRPAPAVEAATEIRAQAALRAGDVKALKELGEGLSAQPGRSLLQERVEALETLARGETGEALRRLRDQRDELSVRGGPDAVKAGLALAVALSSVGRNAEALFEVLTALAGAREASDFHGESACARFLARLCDGSGEPEGGARWLNRAGVIDSSLRVPNVPPHDN